MDDLFENLWICPICSAEHPQPVIVCYRCECQILLLNKIKLTAHRLQQLGYKDLSVRFYDKEK
ncbi:MAG: hypothetical protein H0W88_10405 [Parachlamydiaceae bacterium]|nr:hypothetical protein [Parachlamydiaceae bacterium]